MKSLSHRDQNSGDARSLALFLDLDGTLIDIAATPDGVAAPPGLADLLKTLSHKLGGALAIVSGRPIAEIDRLLAPELFCAAGVHGAEIREKADGDIRLVAPRLSAPLVESVRRLSDLHPGVIVELKSAAVAVHFRQAEGDGAELERHMRALLPQSEDALDLRPGKKVVEIVQRHVTKGVAVQSFMHHAPFSDRRPIVIGDDFTDLSAFEAAEGFDGLGLRVAGEFFDASVADFGETADVRQWLRALSDRLEAEDARGGKH